MSTAVACLPLLTRLRLATAGAMTGNCLTGTVGFLFGGDVTPYRLPAAGLGLLLVSGWLWRCSRRIP